jgi:hypothetical protein
VDFGPGTLGLSARIASAGAGGNIEVRLGATNGTLVGLIPVPVTGGWQTWTTQGTALTNASGVQNLVLRFASLSGTGTAYLFNVNWLEFTPVSTTLSPLDWQLDGGQLQFNWPLDHTGWRLETQTNPPGTGLGTNWTTVQGSSATNRIFMSIGSTNSNVFFRLVYP